MFHHVNKVFIWPKVIFSAVNHLRYSMHGVGLRVLSSPSLSRYFLESFSVNVNQICVSPTSQTLFAMYFLAQKRLSFSDRILRHSESGKYGGCLDCSLFNPKFGPLDASFLTLNGSRARISWEKNGISFSPIHAWSYPFFLLQDLDNTSTLIGLNGVWKRHEENLQRAINIYGTLFHGSMQKKETCFSRIYSSKVYSSHKRVENVLAS